jgi:hypothetical protein
VTKEFYTVLEFAHKIGKSRDRVYEWLRQEIIKGTKVTETGMWIIPATELERLKEGRELSGATSIVPVERSLEEAQREHLNEIAVLTNRWKESLYIPRFNEVEMGTECPNSEVVENPLFRSMKRHLRIPALWREWRCYEGYITEYLRTAKDIRVSVGSEIASWKGVHRPTLHAAQPILDRINSIAHGVQMESCRLSVHVLPDSEFQLLVADGTINLLEAVNAEAYTESYNDLYSGLVAEEAPRLVKLSSDLQDVRNKLDVRLGKILLRHYHVGYKCRLCPVSR